MTDSEIIRVRPAIENDYCECGFYGWLNDNGLCLVCQKDVDAGREITPYEGEYK